MEMLLFVVDMPTCHQRENLQISTFLAFVVGLLFGHYSLCID